MRICKTVGMASRAHSLSGLAGDAQRPMEVLASWHKPVTGDRVEIEIISAE